MIAQVSPAQLNDWLGQRIDMRPVLLDVREPWEVETAHVSPAGFELIAMPMATVPPRLPELDRHRPIACLCHLGGRSMQVAMYLEQHGFDDVANVAGGIHAWSLECDPDVPIY